MMSNLKSFVKAIIKILIDDFSIFRDSFEGYLCNFEHVLSRCEETNLVLNWENCQFMVKEGIVLGHKISHS